MNPYYLLPAGGSGIKNILWFSVLNMSGFGDIIMIPYLAPYLNVDTHVLKNIGQKTILFVGIYFMLVTAGYVMLFPLPSSLEYLTPFFQMSRMAQITIDFQRLEMFFVLAWTFSAFLRVAAGLSFMGLIAQGFGRPTPYRPFVVAAGVLTGVLAYCVRDTFLLRLTIVAVVYHYSFLAVFGAPLLGLCLYKIRQKIKKKVRPVESKA
jgi:hypothetical protein